MLIKFSKVKVIDFSVGDYGDLGFRLNVFVCGKEMSTDKLGRVRPMNYVRHFPTNNYKNMIEVLKKNFEFDSQDMWTTTKLYINWAKRNPSGLYKIGNRDTLLRQAAMTMLEFGLKNIREFTEFEFHIEFDPQDDFYIGKSILVTMYPAELVVEEEYHCMFSDVADLELWYKEVEITNNDQIWPAYLELYRDLKKADSDKTLSKDKKAIIRRLMLDTENMMTHLLTGLPYSASSE